MGLHPGGWLQRVRVWDRAFVGFGIIGMSVAQKCRTSRLRQRRGAVSVPIDRPWPGVPHLCVGLTLYADEVELSQRSFPIWRRGACHRWRDTDGRILRPMLAICSPGGLSVYGSIVERHWFCSHWHHSASLGALPAIGHRSCLVHCEHIYWTESEASVTGANQSAQPVQGGCRGFNRTPAAWQGWPHRWLR